MDFGICLASRPSDLDYVVEAERLGFTHCWMADSQMIWSDVYAMLALAADRTTTMRIGTGVAVAATRPAPVTAAAVATINQMAPGRTFCGIGTGNTAMRIMGHKPMRMAEFDAYLATLRPLLRGEEAPFEWRGTVSPVRHLMPDDGFAAFDPPVPVYVSGFGPRSIGLAARHADGLITGAMPATAVGALRAGLPAMGEAHGRKITREGFPISMLTTTVVLDEGEAVDSPRCRRECGAFAIASLHFAYEQFAQFGRPPPRYAASFWDDYVARVEETPAERRHQRIHLGHNCWVIPEEEAFVTAELIQASCLVGTPAQLASKIHDLEEAGLDQIVVLPPLREKEKVSRDLASRVFPLLAA